MKKLLVLGGTGFIGRYFVEQFSSAGYDVTLYNRGTKKIFPNKVKTLIGDREADDYSGLAKQEWDCVIDFSSYYPHSLHRLLNIIKTKRYIYISTVSVYDSQDGVITEGSKLFECSTEQAKDQASGSYGNRKAECERVLLKASLDTVIFRPCIVYGPYDHTERFYYWLYRLKTQKKILIPAEHHTLLNMTYVKDFCGYIREAIDIKKHGGIYNVVTHEPNTFKQKLEVIAECMGADPVFREISAAKMEKENLQPWADFPVYIPYDRIISSEKLLREFSYRPTPFELSVKETIAHYEKLGWGEGSYGLRLEKELLL
jgi:2'-hydroxyisoflavone reductase